ncbi:MAG: phosphate ABC transporter substrate-binding protein [Lachnospiraceae bacterium]|nr:phosphate ABC transporter substrate-binding protein [Lachnospiraceae bacterium]
MKLNGKKILTGVAAVTMLLTMAVGSMGCGAKNNKNITVLTREDGSGTRGAFIELFGIEEKNADGKKVDNTVETAEITNSTAVMMQTVSGNKNSIGYVSLGSLNKDMVKAVKVDSAEASVENVKNGSYKVSRPFNIATYGDVSELTQDFINFILSEEGQAVVEEEGYISEGNNGAYEKSNGLSGKITVGGSSSVTPVMGKLKEAYEELNPDVSVDVQQTDSSTGMEDTLAGVCQIGMASRALKDSEMEDGLIGQTIALDGIAVIVNKESDISDITSEQVKNIYTGEITSWDDITE